MSAGREARLYLRRRHHGVLSTLSRKFAGYPFGSVVPYVLDHGAQPVTDPTTARQALVEMAWQSRAA